MSASRQRLALAVGGILIAGAFPAMGILAPGRGSPSFMVTLGIAAAGYLLALAAIATGASLSGRALLLCLVSAAAWRVPLLFEPADPAHDAVRYVWDARVQRAGLNPYETRPEDPSLASIHTPMTREVDAAWLPTIYPPIAQLYFRAVTAFHESITAFRVAAIVSDIALMGVLTMILHALGRPLIHVLIFAWHPLPALEGASGAHFDSFGALLLALAALAVVHRRSLMVALAFGGSVLVKPLPLVLLPAIWRALRRRSALAALALFAGLTAWMGRGTSPTGSMGAFIDGFRFNAPLFELAELVLPPRAIAVTAVCAGPIVSLVARRRGERQTWAPPMAAALALSPVIYPWYLVWLVPFVVVRPSLPILVWTISICAVYVAWHVRTADRGLEVRSVLLALEFGPPLLCAAFLYARRRTGEEHCR